MRGFARWLVELLVAARPRHLLCTFDSHDGQGLRRELSAAYKAGRTPPCPDLLDQIERCRGVARAFGLPVLTGGKLEADDLIGHFADQAHRAGHTVTVVTADKDLAQYLEGEDRWWDAGRRDALDVRQVTRRFGVRPDQIPDWLALAGDEADGIAGVPGVGPPTAARLLKRFGDLDSLFAHVGDVATMRFRGAPHVAATLPAHEGTVRAARRLTGRLVDPDLPQGLDACRVERRSDDAIADDLHALGITRAESERHARAVRFALEHGDDSSATDRDAADGAAGPAPAP